MAVIETKALTKSYGRSRGIEGVNLTVEQGDIYGFIGPNGAGKSTTIRTLMGFLYPAGGQALIWGMDCATQSARIKQRVGYVPGEVRYYEDLTGRDIIRYTASFYPAADAARMRALMDAFEVEGNKRIRELSLGNKKKLAIVQALLPRPELIILDEATNGLDPLMQNRLFEVLTEENQRGATLFFSSHNLVEVERFCKRVGVIREGKLIREGNIEELSGVRMRKIEVKLGAQMERPGAPNGASQVQQTAEGMGFLFDGPMQQLIAWLHALPVEDVSISRPSLEETFMHYYEKDGALPEREGAVV